jgi:hypothetical protein
MATLQVDTLTFHFEPNVMADIYDQWQHYTSVWNAPPGGKKAVDVVAVNVAITGESSAEGITWLIEAKDFRVITNPPKPSNIAGLAQVVADKVTHTLAGLADASANAIQPTEKQFATNALASTARRVVLHLEPHTGSRSALFPTGFAASVLQRLRQLVAVVDTNPLVLNIANTPMAGVPWTVS